MEPAALASNVTPLREGEPPYRQPPSNVEAEQALLAAILVNNAAYHRVSEFLRAEHFALGVHGRIYAAINKLMERGQLANPVTLKNLFEQDDALQEVGGAQYLVRLAASVVTIINAEDYGRTIHDLFCAANSSPSARMWSTRPISTISTAGGETDRAGREESFSISPRSVRPRAASAPSAAR